MIKKGGRHTLHISEAFFLIFASSADALTAGFSYGSEGIHIPLRSVFIIDFICTLLMYLGFLFADIVQVIIPQQMLKILCFIILFSVGVSKIFGDYIKEFIKKYPSLHIFCDTTKADADKSKTLSAKEAVALGIALSADGLATSFGAGLAGGAYLGVTLAFLVVNFIMLTLGTQIGKKINTDPARWGGICLIILAVCKLI